jgi:hypothetical protein
LLAGDVRVLAENPRIFVGNDGFVDDDFETPGEEPRFPADHSRIPGDDSGIPADNHDVPPDNPDDFSVLVFLVVVFVAPPALAPSRLPLSPARR